MMAVLQLFCHVFPLSSDFKIPIPRREEFTSPVPTQIVPFSSHCDITIFCVGAVSITAEKHSVIIGIP
jgi:hypothetical protein